MSRRALLRWVGFAAALATCHVSLAAASWPSLFRGVVVADSPVGVRVVSIEPEAQAYQLDLRPEDLIVRIGAHEVHTIEEFGALSMALKGRVTAVEVVVFRGGGPRTLRLHVFSVPILAAWGIEVVPDHDIRFAQSAIGRDYWTRLGRGFVEAGKPAEALDAYVNALHNVPDDREMAAEVARLSLRVGQQRLRARAFPEGIAALARATTLMQRLFDAPLSEPQLQAMKQELQATLEAFRAARQPPPNPSDTRGGHLGSTFLASHRLGSDR
jgi:hypothetical protein